tara:strand:- start:25 stop:450 length:426 start_codon:yes stop_codon:yes gene_type:complete
MIKYFEESYRKDCRKRLVDFLYNYLIQTRYPNDIIAFMIKSWHFTFAYMAVVILLFAPISIGIILTIFLLFYLILFFYLKGCFVSHLEYKLNNHNFINIVDPYIISMNYDITNENRYIGTMAIALVYFCITIPVLFYRMNY